MWWVTSVLPRLIDTPCCVIFHSQILLCVEVVLDELLGPGRWMEGGFVVVRGHHKNNSRRDSTHRWSGMGNFHHVLLQLSCWFNMLFFFTYLAAALLSGSVMKGFYD